MGAGTAVQPQAAPERCPWCGAPISRTRFVEIQARISEEERRKLTEERARMERELRSGMQETEARIKAEAEKKVAAVSTERDRIAAKVKEMEARQAVIRQEATQQAEARIKAEAEKKVAALSTERDRASAKLKELEASKQKDLEQQRKALEEDRDTQLLRLQAERNREREQLQQKIDALTRQVQSKTANQLGDGAEIDVYETLREAFRRDDITRIKKGQPGADIRHQVLDRGSSCGVILVDSKNRERWQNAYVTKLREDQIAAKADYAILATTVFPSGKRELYVDHETGVVVVNRSRAVEVIALLRQALVRMHLLGLTQTQRAEKREKVYAYITSEDFRRHVSEAGRLTSDILGLDVEEKQAHDRLWEKRGKMVTRLRNVVREVDAEIDAILEGRRMSDDQSK